MNEPIISADNIFAFLSPIAVVLIIFIVASSIRSCDSDDKTFAYQRELDRQETIRQMVDEGWSADEIRCVTGKASELFCEYRNKGKLKEATVEGVE